MHRHEKGKLYFVARVLNYQRALGTLSPWSPTSPDIFQLAQKNVVPEEKRRLKHLFSLLVMCLAISALVSFFAGMLEDGEKLNDTAPLAFVDVLMPGARPVNEDQYCRAVLRAEDLQGSVSLGRGSLIHHISAFTPKVDQEHTSPPHHMMLMRCKSFVNRWERNKHVCSGKAMENIGGCQGEELLYVWAHAGTSFLLPDGVGIPIDQESTFALVVHYKDALDGTGIDRSGIRLSLSPGRPLERLVVTTMFGASGFSIPPRTPLTVVEGVQQCLPERFPTTRNYFLFAFRVHAHALGVGNELQVIRKGVPIAQFARDTRLPQSFVMLKSVSAFESLRLEPGDMCRVRCRFNSTLRFV